MNVDCSTYESDDCPKGESYSENIDKKTIEVMMIGCWGVYCWDGKYDLEQYKPDYVNSLDINETQLFSHEEEEYGQKRVVNAMIDYATKEKDIVALFLAGDNIYSYKDAQPAFKEYLENIRQEKIKEGKQSIKYPDKETYKNNPEFTGQRIDLQLSEGFSKCLAGLKENINIYIGVGNHDVQNCVDLNKQLNYHITDPKYNLPAMYYNVVYNLKGFSVNFVMIDTNLYSEKHCDLKKYSDSIIQTQTDWIINTINSSTSEWNIIIGHIPYKANLQKNGKKDNKHLKNLFKSLKESKNKVQVYMCADVHNQQFLYDNDLKLSLVVAGSGGTALDKGSYLKHDDENGTKTYYYEENFGFSSFKFNSKYMTISYHVAREEYRELSFQVVILPDGTMKKGDMLINDKYRIEDIEFK